MYILFTFSISSILKLPFIQLHIQQFLKDCENIKEKHANRSIEFISVILMEIFKKKNADLTNSFKLKS